MGIENGILKIRTRIAALEGRKRAAEAELVELKNIKCPACNGSGQILNKEESSAATGPYYEDCILCEGSGYASGQR